MSHESTDITIIGAGIAGIAAAYYLAQSQKGRICIIDAGQPMSFTSAQSGDNFRNWWPHQIMTEFTDYSIDLLEEINERSANRINMNRGGYLLATRQKNIDALVESLYRGYGQDSVSGIRTHEGAGAGYRASLSGPATGVDLISREIIDTAWPHFDRGINNIFHIRRAGDIDGQQLGQYMLENARERGMKLLKGNVIGIDHGGGFTVHLDDGSKIQSDRLLCAPGPFVNTVLQHLGEKLPVKNVLQQKLAFEDVLGAVPRDQPFSVDLDCQGLDWTDEERQMLGNDEEFQWLTHKLPGGTHCRPEGGQGGKWVKLGWAFNESESEANWNPPLESLFPEVVLRGAARLVPALRQYYECLPARRSHYGGYYTMTEENWPLIGPLKTPDAYVIGALSGFGSMAACAAGSLCAKWMTGGELPAYAEQLSLSRYQNEPFMADLIKLEDKGVL